MTLTAPIVTVGEGAIVLEIEDTDATRTNIRAEALDRFVEYCATQGHVPVGKPKYLFTPGAISTVEVRARVKLATRTWVDAILEKKEDSNV